MPDFPDRTSISEPPARPGDAIALLLAGSLITLPFLLPGSEVPLATFQAEWLAVALGVASAVTMLLTGRVTSLCMPQPACWLLAFALFLVLQAAIGNSTYLQAPMLGAVYVMYAALLIWLGAQLTATMGLERVAYILATFLLAGAMANAVAGMIQFYGRQPLLDDWIARAVGGRAVGNVGQINLYANYLALGQAALIFLWSSKHVRTGWAVPAVALLAVATALSSSRTSLIFLLLFAALGILAARLRNDAATRRLRLASYAVCVLGLLAHAAIPVINAIVMTEPANSGTMQRLFALAGGYSEPRWQLWLLAARIFFDSPLMGTGIGQFAVTAFTSGLPVELAGFIWSSPHNLILALLAETGIAGTLLILGGLIVWWSKTIRRYCSAPNTAMWWIIAGIGVEMLDSMVLFPLWYAQFLGLTALLMGVGIQQNREPSTLVRMPGRPIAAVLCVVLAAASGLMLRDYLRLDSARITGTTLTMAGDDEKNRAATTMRDLTHGPFAPIAEGWILLGASLDRNDLDEKLRWSERVMHYWPSSEMLTRRSVFLALDGKTTEAHDLLENTLRAFPRRCREIATILNRAQATDTRAIAPLLSSVEKMSACTPEKDAAIGAVLK